MTSSRVTRPRVPELDTRVVLPEPIDRELDLQDEAFPADDRRTLVQAARVLDDLTHQHRPVKRLFPSSTVST